MSERDPISEAGFGIHMAAYAAKNRIGHEAVPVAARVAFEAFLDSNSSDVGIREGRKYLRAAPDLRETISAKLAEQVERAVALAAQINRNAAAEALAP